MEVIVLVFCFSVVEILIYILYIVLLGVFFLFKKEGILVLFFGMGFLL